MRLSNLKYFILATLITAAFNSLAQLVANDKENSDSSSTNTSNSLLLLNTNELTSSAGKLCVIDSLGLFYLDQGTLLSLDSISCPNYTIFRLKQNLVYDEIITSGGYLIAKSGPLVVLIDEERSRIIEEFDTDQFFIYPGAAKYLNIVILELDGTWGWYTSSLDTDSLQCVTRMDSPITKIIDRGSYALAVSDTCIYSLTADGLYPLVSNERIIIDAALTSIGLFFITDSGLFMLPIDGTTAIGIMKESFYSLYSDGDVLYIVMENGDVVRLDVTPNAVNGKEEGPVRGG